VIHDYLWSTLRKYGLLLKFIQKIQQLYKSARTIVLVNKILPQAIKIERGVRQGCPMSYLLYDIAIEPLAESIRKSALKGFKIQGLQDRILVSLFADDTIVYINENNNKKILDQVVKSFCETSIAKFNDEKSEVLPMATKEYRDQMIEMRMSNEDISERINDLIRVVKDRESL